MLFDPQTSGGLLIAVAPEHAAEAFAALKAVVPSAQRTGEVVPRAAKAILLR